MNVFLIGRSGLVADEPLVRGSAAVLAVLCAVALALADFGAHRGVGQGIKALGGVMLVALLIDLARRPSR